MGPISQTKGPSFSGSDVTNRKTCLGTWVSTHILSKINIIFDILPFPLLMRYGGPYVGNVPANSRLKIPSINLEDGPQVCFNTKMLTQM